MQYIIIYIYSVFRIVCAHRKSDSELYITRDKQIIITV